jgi:hypothetical protein
LLEHPLTISNGKILKSTIFNIPSLESLLGIHVCIVNMLGTTIDKSTKKTAIFLSAFDNFDNLQEETNANWLCSHGAFTFHSEKTASSFFELGESFMEKKL